MSGFAGIIDRSGTPPEKETLEKMARLIERHGGDSRSSLSGQDFGFVHAGLHSTSESAHEKQPLTLDGQTWIIGDARIDARSELIVSLQKSGQLAESASPDLCLVLLAYLTWGDQCVQHLLGDFAFAAWNSVTGKLFCARDHFGIKPFYYSRHKSLFIFSNDLKAVKSHESVSDTLDGNAICDYLAFGYNLDETTTSFRDIKRIPPGHSLSATGKNTPSIRNYRQFPTSNRIRYNRESEYSDHFFDLFSRAVNDRLRANRVSFEMSGGLDSTSVAALATHLQKDSSEFSGLAITTDTSHLFPEVEEARFAMMVADECQLDHVRIKAGLEEDFYTCRETSEPYAWPFAATTIKFANTARQHSKVLLGGQFGDVLFQGSGIQIRDEFRNTSPGGFIANRMRAVIEKRSLRAIGIRSLLSKDRPLLPLPDVPDWIRMDVLEKSGSEDRWRELFHRRNRYPDGCQAELMFDEMHLPFWSHLFESYYHDLLCGIDCRQPFMDLRLLEFTFSIPASVKRSKNLLRKSMAGLLPSPVLNRPKTNVSQDMVQNILAKPGIEEKLPRNFEHSRRWINEMQYRQALHVYAQSGDTNLFTILGPLGLERWKCD